MTMHVIPNLFRSITFYIKMSKLANFSKFRTHDLEKLSPKYEKAPFTQHRQYCCKDATPCSYRDMLQTKLEIARYISHLSTCFCACAQKQRIQIEI